VSSFWYQDTADENEKRIPAFPFPLIKVPAASLEAIQPEGWTMEEFAPHIRGVQAALEIDDLSLIDVPEGLTVEAMVESVLEILLYAQAGVALISNRQKIIEDHIERIQTLGLTTIIGQRIVLDSDFRVIEGLPWVWALSALGFTGVVAVIIRYDADPYAGLRHVRHLQDQYQKSRVNQDYDAIQALIERSAPEERELLAKAGHFPTRETVELQMSRETLRLLGNLIAKHLGYEIVKVEAAKAKKRSKKPVERGDLKIRLDPAQLLYVDTLREQITAARLQEIDPDAELDTPEKLQRHLDEEATAIAAGKDFIGREGGWKSLGDGVYEHWAFPMYRFRIVESEVAPESAPEPTADQSPYLMEQSQFRIFAKAHFGLDESDADQLHAAESADGFNRRLRHYINATPTIYEDKYDSQGKRKGKGLIDEQTPKRMALSDQEARLKLWRSALKD
jgi:hypothetical protein